MVKVVVCKEGEDGEWKAKKSTRGRRRVQDDLPNPAPRFPIVNTGCLSNLNRQEQCGLLPVVNSGEEWGTGDAEDMKT